jgi:hypothetical protein
MKFFYELGIAIAISLSLFGIISLLAHLAEIIR